MISFNSTNSTFNISCLVVEKHITVQSAAEALGYNVQYLRRLLRAGKLDGIKVGQVWLIRLDSLLAYFERAKQAIDRRYGPKISQLFELNTNVNSSCLQMFTGLEKGEQL
jgi:excisionase family DNA binding protein